MALCQPEPAFQQSAHYQPSVGPQRHFERSLADSAAQPPKAEILKATPLLTLACLSTLGKWLAQYRPSDLVAAPQADLARENERLRLENRVLREESEVLAHIREQYPIELKEVGLNVGERRVGRLMKINGIKPVRTRKHKVTTDSHHRLACVHR